ncbi:MULTISPECIES: hypothetical protein [unclassified Streptomyces]|uniref:hypothetical protein n=1 Tax=unclassified Streptomyces TaxID=2593676 RepID=UPI0037F37D1D
MDDLRRSVAVLAARVRAAHAARVWLPLGHSSWESYCRAEFGVSRAQTYRLLDVARAYLSDTEAADVLALLCDSEGRRLFCSSRTRRFT